MTNLRGTPKRSTRLPVQEPKDGLRDFSKSLPMALLRAREAVMARFRPILRRHGITEQQWRVLRALHSATGALQPSALARMTLLSLPSLSRLLRTLEERKLVRRTTDREDLRAAYIFLTALGRRLVASIAPVQEANYVEITRLLGARDVDQLYALLESCSTRLGADQATHEIDG